MTDIIRLGEARGRELFEKLSRRSRGIPEDVRTQVRAIVEDVRARGDQALCAYTEKFDGVRLTPDKLRVTPREMDEALAQIEPELLAVMRRAADNIRAFHEKQKQNSWLDMQPGVLLGQKVTPLDRVGLYVPGGQAAYPSTVLMNALPAKVAGVGELVMVTPPMKDASVYANTLAAAKIAGVDTIYKVGGAQAVAALAFGTQTLPRVDKITGPGNIYVAAAKREVYGYVGIDMIAGPSEVLVLADSSARADYVAADLLSQAEHDAMAAAILITTDEGLADAVQRELARQLTRLPRRELAQSALDGYGAIILAPDMAAAVAAANELSPEHLELAVENPLDLLGDIRNAGAIFLGHHTPEPVGDYFAGPNHTLPTSGTARFFSPLSVDDFVKKSSVLYYSRQALQAVYADVARFAQSEGLDAHARSAQIRFEGGEK
ncbi:MAG: histidinol dehydrogenase [Eubacteriales bacterium]|nr:histidinol dehydrogenase [Eubacteriales bacterium]